MSEEDAIKIVKRLESLQAERSSFDSKWQDIADLVMPNRSFTAERSPGASRRLQIFDNTAGESHERLVGQVYGMLTNPAIRWVELMTETGDERPTVRRWLADVRDIMLAFLGRSATNLYPALAEVYDDWAGFGTGCLYADNRGGKLQFRSTPLGHVWVEEDHNGIVDTVYREIRLTAQQAIEKFGMENLDESILEKAKAHSIDSDKYIHCVGPRRDYDPYRLGPKGMPYYSLVVSKKQKKLVHEGGFRDFPFMVPRWKKASCERYGRGPAMTVLQEIRMVNAMARSALVSAEKAADPPVQMPDSGFMGPVRLGPNGINYYRMSAGNARIEPIQTGARPDYAEKLVDRHRESIRRGFFNDLFELPQLDRMTATEVMQRQQERMQMFSPTLIRVYNELLDPLIKLTYSHLRRQGRLPPPPIDMSTVNLKIDYVSPLARSQKASEPGGFGQWMAVMGPLAQLDPTVMDIIHPDRMGQRIAQALPVPEQGLRTEDEIAQVRQARAEQQAAMQEAEMAQSIAGAAKDGASAVRELSQV